MEASAQESVSLAWVEANDGYEVALDGRELVFRNPRGKRLQAVPRELRACAVAEQLLALRDWLDGHGNRCRRAVEQWMLLEVSLPREALELAWRDEAWRTALHGALVELSASRDPDFLPSSALGILVGVDPAAGVEVIDADSAAVSFDAESVKILHPTGIPGLDGWRKLAAQFPIKQGLTQLTRSLPRVPKRRAKTRTELNDYERGVFARQAMLEQRCHLMGYEIVDGDAVCAVRSGRALTEARYHVGNGEPSGRGVTGSLSWVDRKGLRIPLAKVGRVAWAEGVRMAESIFSGRASIARAVKRSS